MFDFDIYMYRNWKRKNQKDPETNPGDPLVPTNFGLQMLDYCMWKNQLCNNVPLQQTINESEFVGHRYLKRLPNLAEPNQTVRIMHFFGGFLTTMNSDQFIIFCIEIMLETQNWRHIFDGPKGSPVIFLHNKDLGQSARIFTKTFSSFYTWKCHI